MAQRLRPQSTKQQTEQSITQETSIATVKVLLETGIGCISYLRGLFGEENFADHSISCPKASLAISKSDSTSGSNASAAAAALAMDEKEKAKNVSTVKVKKLIRGTTPEADKLLDYIEEGAADAISKSYLHQLMLAIYLDPEDPTNLVECYTFTFRYETDKDGNKKPEMIVRDQMSGMVISSTIDDRTANKSHSKVKGVKDGDAKRQAQKMIKTLIVSTQALDELPRRRFITIRFYYTEDTPADYEPPLFKPVDANESKFRVTTAQVNDCPEIATLGSLSTGYHGVSLTMVSVAPCLEVDYDDSISLDECLSRNQQDASERKVVWDAEELMDNGHLDSDGIARPMVPRGIAVAADTSDTDSRDEVLLSVEEVLERAVDEKALEEVARKVGLVENDHQHQQEELEVNHVILAKGEDDLRARLSKKGSGRAGGETDNDALRKVIAEHAPSSDSASQATQIAPIVSRQQSHRPPVPLFAETPAQYRRRSIAAKGSNAKARTDEPSSQLEAFAEEDSEMGEIEKEARFVDPKALLKQHIVEQGFPSASIVEEAELDPETQLLNYDQDTLEESASQPRTRSQLAKQPVQFDRTINVANLCKAAPQMEDDEKSDGTEVVQCECQDPNEDGGMFQCDECSTWKHVVCYGFFNTGDDRIPDPFNCYSCRGARAESTNEQAQGQDGRAAEIARALNELSGLALFRRALVLLASDGICTQKFVSRQLNVDTATAAQCNKRLKKEGFTYDRPLNKAKSKSHSPRVAVDKSEERRKLRDATYFSPGGGAESQWISLIDGSKDGDANMEDDQPVMKEHSHQPITPSSPPTVLPVVNRSPPSIVQQTKMKTSTATTPTAQGGHQQQSLITRMNSLEEDPILDSDLDEDDDSMNRPLVTPEQATKTMKLNFARKTKEIAQQKQKQKQKENEVDIASLAPKIASLARPSPYVPSFSKIKGKGKADVKIADASSIGTIPLSKKTTNAFQRASSIIANSVISPFNQHLPSINDTTDRMIIEQQPSFSTDLSPRSTHAAASGSKQVIGRKRTVEDIDEDAEGEDDDGWEHEQARPVPFKKAKKCSEAGYAIEV